MNSNLGERMFDQAFVAMMLFEEDEGPSLSLKLCRLMYCPC